MPPSAIAGTPRSRQAAAHSSTAVNCGTPTPATTRVVQMLPGPMPIFTASAPASISASAPSGVATLPAITCTTLDSFLIALTASSTPREWPCAVSTTITSASAATRARARADAGGGGDAQPAQLVLVGQRVRVRLVHVLDGNQADAAIRLVHHQQLLDAVAVQQVARLLRVHPGLHGHQAVARHQLVDPRVGIGGEADVAVGQDADQPPGAGLHHRDAADVVLRLQRADVGQGLVGVDGDRVDHHAGFELLDLADLGGLLGGRQVLVDHPDAAKLGHADRHGAFGDGVHRRGDQRDVQRYLAGEPGAGLRGGRQDLRVAGHQQDIIEGERLLDSRGGLRGAIAGDVERHGRGRPFPDLGGPTYGHAGGSASCADVATAVRC